MRKFWLLLLVFYVGGYIAFRQSFAEPWDKDNRTYVMFPEGPVGLGLYYLWRPLSYIDQNVSGYGAHFGPHR